MQRADAVVASFSLALPGSRSHQRAVAKPLAIEACTVL
jgi:hypothetical protein